MEPDRSFASSWRAPVALAIGLVAGALVVPAGATGSTPAAVPVAPNTPAPGPAPIVPLAAYPVAPTCWFYDTWLAPRPGGRVHEGLDIGAAAGSPVFAVVSGTIAQIYVDRPGLRSGNAIRLQQADRTYFYYAHLQSFAEGVTKGTQVTAGQVIGYVGQTGNAISPHLHLEIHPGGGNSVNPHPSLKAVKACTRGAVGPTPPVPPATTPPATTPATQPAPAATTAPAGTAAPTPAPAPAPVGPGASPVVGGATRLGLVAPTRIADTRAGVGGRRLPANTTVAFRLGGVKGLPQGATAAIVNLWVASPSGSGSIVAFSCDSAVPAAASLAYSRGQLVGSLVHVGTPGGTVCLRSSAATDVILDVVAADGSQGGAGLTAIAPTRLHDSRTIGARLAAGEVRVITASGVGGVPPSNGLTLSVTAVGAAKTGTVTVWPCDRNAPGLPALVVTKGATASATTVSRVAADGTICVKSSATTDIVVDAVSAWAVGGGASLRAMTPARLTDTRSAGGRVSGGGVLEVGVAGRGGVGGGASGAAITVTATGAAGSGAVTVWPCGQARPGTASLTLVPGGTASAMVLVGLGGGRVCLSPSASTNLVVDVAGFAG